MWTVHDLPAELIDSIMCHLPVNDLPRACLATRRFHHGCTRLFYRNVVLSGNPLRGLRCLITLGRNPTLASHVRLFLFCSNSLNLVRQAYMRVLRSALTNLVNVLEIFMNVTPALFDWIVADLRFPRLRKIEGLSCVGMMQFLVGHPNLVNVLVKPVSTSNSPAVDVLAQTLLPIPSLQRCYGPPSIAIALVPGSSVVRAYIRWPAEGVTAETMRRLMSSTPRTSPQLEFLSNVLPRYNSFSPSLITRYFPNISALHFLVSSSTLQEREAFLSTVDVILPSLPSLLRFSIDEQRPPNEIDFTANDIFAEFCLVRRWALLCQTLTECVLHTNTHWVRRQDWNVWAPRFLSLSGDPPADRRVYWWMRMVVLNLDETLPATYLDYLKGILVDGGVDSLRAEIQREEERAGLVLALDD
ncbi:hypothetical protein C8F01DRAFT_1129431 [Mycena amicta]|nr:hypothetical protein C8F01DRAFT_1129431 [Mycena amicta]